MKTRKTVSIVLLSILFIWGMNSCTKSTHKTQHKDSTEETHEHKHENGEHTEYQCPMKCEKDKTYSKEGNCPSCKMKLEPIHGNHGH